MNEHETFERQRPAMLALAYRMLGEVARAEDVVQEAWVRWRRHDEAVDSPRAFLLTTVARLCLDELGSARARREEPRGDRLPEPVDLAAAGLDAVELAERVSMAFLVVLQRLTPAERAVLLLHDIFELSHGEIAALLGRSEAACRQALKRARENVASERRSFHTSPDEHRRMVRAFVAAAATGDRAALAQILAEDAVLVVDGGPEPARFGKLRNLGRPVVGRSKIIPLIESFARQEPAGRLSYEERILNGQPAMVAFLDGRPLSALLVAVVDGRVSQLFFQNDPARLRHLGRTN